MGDARCSERLRKRPRVSYAQPDEEDLDIDDEGSGLVTAAVSEAKDGGGGDEEFSLNGRKRKKTASTKKCGRGKKHQAFRFMDLPGELRNAIYELTLKCAPIELRYAWKRGRHKIKSSGLQTYSLNPNLLLLNKNIRAEAGPILYQNQFNLLNCTALWHFTSALSPTTKSWIKHLGLEIFRNGHIDKGYCVPAFHSLIGMTNLESLELIWIGEPSFTRAQDFFRDASIWIESVGREKEDKYAALELIILSKGSARLPYDPRTGRYSYHPYSQTERDARDELFRSKLKHMIN